MLLNPRDNVKLFLGLGLKPYTHFLEDRAKALHEEFRVRGFSPEVTFSSIGLKPERYVLDCRANSLTSYF